MEAAFTEAAEQVARYASDARLVPLLTQGQTLQAGMLVFVGAKKVLFRAWPAEEGKPRGEGPARAGGGRKAVRKAGTRRAKRTP